MPSKALIVAALIGSIFFAGTASAYDLPKIKPDKISAETAKGGMFKSDWTSFEKFEREIQAALAENENLPASSPARVTADKNIIFVAYYKGTAYFLDRYSIQNAKDKPARRSWSQHIFPIGKNISAQNSRATAQDFSTDGVEIYNSRGKRKKISAVTDAADRDFLTACFSVGYFYAFGEVFDKRRHW